MAEIEKPKSEIVKLRRGKRYRGESGDIPALKESCLALANEIERCKDQTPWPNWSQDQANSLRDYANDLPD